MAEWRRQGHNQTLKGRGNTEPQALCEALSASLSVGPCGLSGLDLLVPVVPVVNKTCLRVCELVVNCRPTVEVVTRSVAELHVVRHRLVGGAAMKIVEVPDQYLWASQLTFLNNVPEWYA